MFSRQQCPICGELFHAHALQSHVNSCLDKQQQISSPRPEARSGGRGTFTSSFNSLHRLELEISAKKLVSDSIQKTAPIPLHLPKSGTFVVNIAAGTSSTPPFLEVGVVLSSDSRTEVKVGFIRNLSSIEQLVGSLSARNDITPLNLHKSVSIEQIAFGERKSFNESTQLVLDELLQSNLIKLSWRRSYLHPLPSLETKSMMLSSNPSEENSEDFLTIDGIIFQPLRWLGTNPSDGKFRAYCAVPDVFHSYGVLPLYLPHFCIQSIQSIPRPLPSALFARAVEVLSSSDMPISLLGGRTWITIEFVDEDEAINTKRRTLKTDERTLCSKPVFFSPEGLCDCDKDHALYLETLSTANDKESAKKLLRERKLSSNRKKRLMNAATALSSGGLSYFFSNCRCQTAWYIHETSGYSRVIIRLWRRTSSLSAAYVFAEGSLDLKSLAKAQIDRLCSLSQEANEESQVVCAFIPPCLLQTNQPESGPQTTHRASLKRSRPFRTLTETISLRSTEPLVFEVEESPTQSLRQQLRYLINDYEESSGLSVGDVLLRALEAKQASISMKAAVFNERRQKPVSPQGSALAIDRIAAAISMMAGKVQVLEKKAVYDASSQNDALSTSSPGVFASSILLDVSSGINSDYKTAPLSTLLGAESMATSLFETTSHDGLAGAISLPSFTPPTWRLDSPLNPLSSTNPSEKENLLALIVDKQGKVQSVQENKSLSVSKKTTPVLLDPGLLDLCVTLRKPGPGSLDPQPVRIYCATDKYTTKKNESVFRVQFRHVTESDVTKPYGVGCERSQPLLWAAVSGHHALLSILLRHFDVEIDPLREFGFGKNATTSSSIHTTFRVSSLRRSDGLSALDLAMTSPSADHTRCVGILIKHFHIYNKEHIGRSRISPFTSSSDPTCLEGENSTLSRNSLHFAVLGGSTVVVQMVARLHKLFQKQHDACGQLPFGLALCLLRSYLSVVLVGPHGWIREERSTTSPLLANTIRQMFPWANPFELLLPPEFGFAAFRLMNPYPHGRRRVHNGTWSLGAAPEVLAVNSRGVTPLHENSAKGNVDAVAILLHLGANATAVFDSSRSIFVTEQVSLRAGDTPLHSVVQFFITSTCHRKRDTAMEIINLLLESGAAPLSHNAHGDTVFHDISLAFVHDKSQELIKLLRFFLQKLSEPTGHFKHHYHFKWQLSQHKATANIKDCLQGRYFAHEFRNNQGNSPMDVFVLAGGNKLEHSEAFRELSVFPEESLIKTKDVHRNDEAVSSLFSESLQEASFENILVKLSESGITPSPSIPPLLPDLTTTTPATSPTTLGSTDDDIEKPYLSSLPKLGSLLFSFVRQPYNDMHSLLRHSCSACGAKTTSILDVRLMDAPWLNPPCRTCGSLSSTDLRAGDRLDERWRMIAAKLSGNSIPNDLNHLKNVTNSQDSDLHKSDLRPIRLAQRIINEVTSLGYAVLSPTEVEAYRHLVANAVCSQIEEMGLVRISQSKAISALDANAWSFTGSVSSLVTNIIEQVNDHAIHVDDASKALFQTMSPASSQKFSCSACLEDVETTESFSLACLHRFCMTCWRAHLAASLEREGGPDGVDLVRCLAQPECKEKVNEEAWRLCADSRTFDLYKRWKLQGFTQRNKRLISCGNPSKSNIVQNVKINPLTATGCKNFLLLSHEGLLRSNDLHSDELASPFINTGRVAVTSGLQILRNVDLDTRLFGDPVSVARCSCGYVMCVDCGQEAHSPASCRDITRWRELVSDETDASSIRLLLSTTKKCPHCSAFIFRDGGCPHIRCAACKHEFCHVCRAAWTGYDHRCKPEFSELTPMSPVNWNRENGLSMEESTALGRRNVISKKNISSSQISMKIQEKKRAKDLRKRYDITSIDVGTQSAAQDFILRRIQHLSSSKLEQSFYADLGRQSSRTSDSTISVQKKYRRDIESRVNDNRRISNSLNELRSSMRFVIKSRSLTSSFRLYDPEDSHYVINLSPEYLKTKLSDLMTSLSASWTRIVTIAHYIALAFDDKDACFTWKSIAPLFYALLEKNESFDLCCSSTSWDFMLRHDGTDDEQGHFFIPWIDVLSNPEVVAELLIASDFLPTAATSGSDLLQIALASGVCSALVSSSGDVDSISSASDRPLRQPWFQCLDCAEKYVGCIDFNESRRDRSSGAGANPIKEINQQYWKRSDGPLDEKIGICASCAMSCHRGHSVQFVGIRSRSCQCGQGLCRGLFPPVAESLRSHQSMDVGGRIAFLPSHSRSLSSANDSTSSPSNDEDLRLSLRLFHGCVAISPGLLASSTLACARAIVVRNVAEISGQILEPFYKTTLTTDKLQRSWQELREDDELFIKKQEMLSVSSQAFLRCPPQVKVAFSLASSLSPRELLLKSLLQFISSSRFLQNILIQRMFVDHDNHWNNNVALTSSDHLRVGLFNYRIQLLKFFLDDLFSCLTPFADYPSDFDRKTIAGVNIYRASTLASAAHQLCQSFLLEV